MQREKPAYTRRQDSPLAVWRVSTGLSLREISFRLGVSRNSWIRYERSGIYPNRLYPKMRKLQREVKAEREERDTLLDTNS